MELLPGPMALRWWNRFDPTRRSYIFPPFYTLKYETACRRVISSCWNQKNGQWIETTTTRKRKKNERERERRERRIDRRRRRPRRQRIGRDIYRTLAQTRATHEIDNSSWTRYRKWRNQMKPPFPSPFSLFSVCVCVYVTHPDESIQ